MFNRLLLLELDEAAFRIALKERYGNDWSRRRYDGRARRRAARLVSAVASAWTAALDSFRWTEFSIEDVHGHVPNLMARHGVASYDAVHAATAIVGGARNLVTTDAGLVWIPEVELTLYVDASRVRSCRARRIPTRRRT